MEFSDVTLSITTVAGATVVPTITVLWKGRQSFSLAPADPRPTDPTAGTLPSGQPFSIVNCRADANPNYRIADLTFDSSAISSWHPTFDLFRTISLDVAVANVGTKRLRVNLSCTQHPLTASARIALLARAAVVAVQAFVAFAIQLLRLPFELLRDAGRKPSRSGGLPSIARLPEQMQPKH